MLERARLLLFPILALLLLGADCQPGVVDPFDPDRLHEYRFNLPARDWENLIENARDEEYTSARLTIAGNRFDDVGIRFKGSGGTLFSCFDENDELICPKLSIKLKMDEYVDGQELNGFDKINFHSNIRDPSLMAERLGYWLLGEFGVVAPRAVHAKLYVNNEFIGIFTAVEEVEEAFIADRFPEAPGGNVYKETWPVHTNEELHISRLQTNESQPDVSAMIELANVVLGSEPKYFKGDTANLLDSEAIARWLAADFGLSTGDGPTKYNWIEDLSVLFSKNYFLYEFPSTNKQIRLIPWDLDQAWDIPNRIDGSGVPRWNVTDPECDVVYTLPPPSAGGVKAASCDPAMARLSWTLWESFVAHANELLDGPFDVAALQQRLDVWAEQIRPSVVEDPNGVDPGTWEVALAGLRNNRVPTARERLVEHLSATPPPPLLVVNEVGANGSDSDFVEIWNSGGVTADLGGYALAPDGAADPGDPDESYLFPAGTVLAPGDFVTVAGLTGGSGAHVAPFDLAATAGEPTLYGPDGVTFMDSLAYEDPDGELDASFGRYPDGATASYALASATPGAANIADPSIFPPAIGASQPRAGATGVMPNPVITVSFTHDMEAVGAVTVAGASAPFEFEEDDAIEIGPVDLAAFKGSPVTVTLTGFEDEDGVPLGNTAFQFTVEAASPEIVINELVNGDGEIPDTDEADWIELANTTGADIDLGVAGYSIADSGASFSFASGTVVPAGGYLVILANDQDGNEAGRVELPFKLGSSELITLTDGVGVDRQTIFWQEDQGRDGNSFQRAPDLVGGFLDAAPSPGAANE